jgi:hypothetical protein
MLGMKLPPLASPAPTVVGFALSCYATSKLFPVFLGKDLGSYQKASSIAIGILGSAATLRAGGSRVNAFTIGLVATYTATALFKRWNPPPSPPLKPPEATQPEATQPEATQPEAEANVEIILSAEQIARIEGMPKGQQFMTLLSELQSSKLLTPDLQDHLLQAFEKNGNLFLRLVEIFFKDEDTFHSIINDIPLCILPFSREKNPLEKTFNVLSENNLLSHLNAEQLQALIHRTQGDLQSLASALHALNEIKSLDILEPGQIQAIASDQQMNSLCKAAVALKKLNIENKINYISLILTLDEETRKLAIQAFTFLQKTDKDLIVTAFLELSKKSSLTVVNLKPIILTITRLEEHAPQYIKDFLSDPKTLIHYFTVLIENNQLTDANVKLALDPHQRANLLMALLSPDD